MFFKPENLKELYNNYSKLNSQCDDLLSVLHFFPFCSQDARIYAIQGFGRRVKTLKRCIENVYTIHPPNKSQEPTEESFLDLAINIQSFIYNSFACIENLAWVWAKEYQFEYKSNKEISFSNKNIRGLLSPEFKNYLDSDDYKNWLKNLADFRHALAHRVPLYVIPNFLSTQDAEQFQIIESQILRIMTELDSIRKIQNTDTLEFKEANKLRLQQIRMIKKLEELTAEKDTLGRFIPAVTHSYEEESSIIVFHAQLLADWNTILEFSQKFIEELKYQSSNNRS